MDPMSVSSLKYRLLLILYHHLIKIIHDHFKSTLQMGECRQGEIESRLGHIADKGSVGIQVQG
jgi:hypothetical protein